MSLLGDLAGIAATGVAASVLTKAFKKGGGAHPPSPAGPEVNFYNLQGNSTAVDTRVIIKVPKAYLTSYTGLNGELGSDKSIKGIIFPYTPTISVENKADYETINPTHSNFNQYFYKHSSVGTISIQGKFTVQNESDAAAYISTVQLLRALTKMQWGNDPFAGSPPPVCRLNAYGAYMFPNVPITITSFRLELPESVDYFTAGANPNGAYAGSSFGKNPTSVPILSTIAITCIPMYSRQEISSFSIDKWLVPGSSLSKNSGFI